MLAERVVGELPHAEYGHRLAEIAGSPVRLIRESPALCPGFTVIGERSAATSVKEELMAHGRDLGVVEVDAASFDIFRIEAGTPVFGHEVTEKNLPQELGRDVQAINFVKGCYLGQETVARLDALGHVNQLLKGLVFAAGSACPGPGSPVEHEGKRSRRGDFGRVLAVSKCPPWAWPWSGPRTWLGHPRERQDRRRGRSCGGDCERPADPWSTLTARESRTRHPDEVEESKTQPTTEG